MSNPQLQKIQQAGEIQPRADINPEQKAIAKLTPEKARTMGYISATAQWSACHPITREKRIKQAIARIGVTLGAKPPEDEDETTAYELFISQVQQHYHKFTPEEMVQAFELNCTGAEWIPVQYFGNLNFPFFCQVMREYTNYRSRAVKDFNQKLILEIKDQNQPEQKSKEEHNRETYEFIINHRKETGAWPFADYHAAWQHFWYQQRLKKEDVEEFFKTESEKIKKEIVNLQFAKGYEINALNSEAVRLQTSPEALKAECRRRFLQQWLEKNKKV